MRVVHNNSYDTRWFVVAFEEEFTSHDCNILYLEEPGKISAAMATQWLIENYDVSEIINIGTAGGNPNKVEKGKVYEIGEVADRDWKTPNCALPSIKVNEIKGGLNTCYTGDSFVTDWNNDFDIVDMEAYAIAKVCKNKENCIPFSCYKYISDTGSDIEWKESLGKCNKVFNEMFM